MKGTIIINGQPILLAPLMDVGVFYAPYIPKAMTKPKYQFSRAKWYVADFDWVHQAEVLEWCSQQFGPHPTRPDAWSRWQQKFQEQIHFRDSKDYVLYQLRWA